jgi:hypothetical protein
VTVEKEFTPGRHIARLILIVAKPSTNLMKRNLAEVTCRVEESGSQDPGVSAQ